ncbi:MAG: type II toxin-antitoxin system ParD family antitoxin [Rickettsiales bacterium]
MNVSLTPELEQYIDAKVKSGFYHSASEVVREGLRLLEEQDAVRKKRLDMLNLEIDKGLASLKAGNVINDVEMKEHIENRRKKFRDQHG